MVLKLLLCELDGCFRNFGNGGVLKEGNCDSFFVGFIVVLLNMMWMLLLFVILNVWVNVVVIFIGGSGYGVFICRFMMLFSFLFVMFIFWYICGSCEYIGLERWSFGGE